MQAAKGQAEGYARDVPSDEGRPPFLIVCDVGFCFDLYADFSGTGGHYAQCPDRERFRIYLPDLCRPEVRALLRQVWTNPKSLDPALHRAQVTRDIAALLAKLAAALEGTPARPRHAPSHVATFLMRCIFCMFAQSVGLLPPGSFSKLLERCRANLPGLVPLVGNLWHTMDTGGFCVALEVPVPRFNGGLFRPGPHGGADPLPVAVDELDWLRKEQFAMNVNQDAVLPAWPKDLPAQCVAVRAALTQSGLAGPKELAQKFRRVSETKLVPILKTLAALGQIRQADSGRYVA